MKDGSSTRPKSLFHDFCLVWRTTKSFRPELSTRSSIHTHPCAGRLPRLRMKWTRSLRCTVPMQRASPINPVIAWRSRMSLPRLPMILKALPFLLAPHPAKVPPSVKLFRLGTEWKSEQLCELSQNSYPPFQRVSCFCSLLHPCNWLDNWSCLPVTWSMSANTTPILISKSVWSRPNNVLIVTLKDTIFGSRMTAQGGEPGLRNESRRTKLPQVFLYQLLYDLSLLPVLAWCARELGLVGERFY